MSNPIFLGQNKIFQISSVEFLPRMISARLKFWHECRAHGTNCIRTAEMQNSVCKVACDYLIIKII